MSVNWFTVAAQIVNFLILVWLLKKFLYKPVLTAMNNRQQKVQDELEQAARLTETAEKEKKRYFALQEEARNRGKEELLKARREAEALRKKLFHEVEAEAEAAHIRWQDELSREKARFLKEASAQVAEQFQHLAQSAFRDLADADLEENMISRFCVLIAKHDTEPDFSGNHKTLTSSRFTPPSPSQGAHRMQSGRYCGNALAYSLTSISGTSQPS